MCNLLNTIEQLILQNDNKLAKKLLNDNMWKIDVLDYNDLMATVFYIEDNYFEALELLLKNEALAKKSSFEVDWLLSTYFQIANCFNALNNNKNAATYYNKCLLFLNVYDPLYFEIQSIMHSENIDM